MDPRRRAAAARAMQPRPRVASAAGSAQIPGSVVASVAEPESELGPHSTAGSSHPGPSLAQAPSEEPTRAARRP
eukprot:8543989-Alexandrium_andersonii.AAC.1